MARLIQETNAMVMHLSERFPSSAALLSLEDRIERKLQQKFTELQATSNATLREVQLIRKELTSSQQDVRLPSDAEGAGFAPWAYPMHRAQSLSCRSEAGSVHIPSGPGDKQHTSMRSSQLHPLLRVSLVSPGILLMGRFIFHGKMPL